MMSWQASLLITMELCLPLLHSVTQALNKFNVSTRYPRVQAKCQIKVFIVGLFSGATFVNKSGRRRLVSGLCSFLEPKFSINLD